MTKPTQFETVLEAQLLVETAASELQHPTTTERMTSFKMLQGFAAVELYEHLSQLIHIHKSSRH